MNSASQEVIDILIQKGVLSLSYQYYDLESIGVSNLEEAIRNGKYFYWVNDKKRFVIIFIKFKQFLGDVNGTELLIKNCIEDLNNLKNFQPLNLAAEIGDLNKFMRGKVFKIFLKKFPRFRQCENH